jgi:hypothetical protein
VREWIAGDADEVAKPVTEHRARGIPGCRDRLQREPALVADLAGVQRDGRANMGVEEPELAAKPEPSDVVVDVLRREDVRLIPVVDRVVVDEQDDRCRRGRLYGGGRSRDR